MGEKPCGELLSSLSPVWHVESPRFPLDLGVRSLGRSKYSEASLVNVQGMTRMYCVHCGASGAIAFCATCGKRQPTASDNESTTHSDPVETIIDAMLVDVDQHDAGADWVDSLDYELVLRQDCVRQRLAAAGRDAPAGLTSDDLLSIFDAVSPIGISLGKLNEALLPIYDKMGLKVQRTAMVLFAAPAGRVLAAALSAMASLSLEIKEVRQQPDACACIAKIPSGLMTQKGELMISIQRGEHIEVRVGSKIAGQLYDWGRSTRLIDQLIVEVSRDLNEQSPGKRTAFRRVA